MKNCFLLIGLLLVNVTAQAGDEQSAIKLDELKQNMQKVVPYSVELTLQGFSKTVHGGVQHVVVKSVDDASQIALIQGYLLKLAGRLRKGDFSDAERLHGKNMAGLAQLKMAKTDDIRFVYKALENGGQIHYSTEYPQFVAALHGWFDAQNSEHGNITIPGHGHHHSSPAN
ncbi:aspartate carbamoyltransferase [Methylomonas koyamae]|uniref:aspartate carbamoyltransferase n=1 Tax=Methylomonas koyamae TaxID=702114 RepID=UPI000BC33CD7|nr:aspartate carbamoyltransferase [Methylomonas koyamae]ATG90131.1 hypothetical protein MKLM6_1896 [Methylomonas koyamae]